MVQISFISLLSLTSSLIATSESIVSKQSQDSRRKNPSMKVVSPDSSIIIVNRSTKSIKRLNTDNTLDLFLSPKNDSSRIFFGSDTPKTFIELPSLGKRRKRSSSLPIDLGGRKKSNISFLMEGHRVHNSDNYFHGDNELLHENTLRSPLENREYDSIISNAIIQEGKESNRRLETLIDEGEQNNEHLKQLLEEERKVVSENKETNKKLAKLIKKGEENNHELDRIKDLLGSTKRSTEEISTTTNRLLYLIGGLFSVQIIIIVGYLFSIDQKGNTPHANATNPTFDFDE